jgi:type VI secretion system VasD/TssJ family lipoprotein
MMSGMRRVRTLVFLVVAGALVIGLVGGLNGCCTLGVGPCTISDRFTLAGANDLNACGGDEQSHPVAVRFYALKGIQKFQGSTFEDIWSDAGQTLGGELVGDPEKVFIEPGGQEIVQLPRGADVTAIGVLANFCDQNDQSVRRKVFELGKRGTKKSLKLRGINLTVD